VISGLGTNHIVLSPLVLTKQFMKLLALSGARVFIAESIGLKVEPEISPDPVRTTRFMTSYTELCCGPKISLSRTQYLSSVSLITLHTESLTIAVVLLLCTQDPILEQRFITIYT
jgi:hypothetical protein